MTSEIEEKEFPDDKRNNPSTIIKFSKQTEDEDEKTHHHQQQQSFSFVLFNFDLSSLSTNVQFGILTLAVFLFYGLYGVCMETFFRQEELKSHGWYLTLVQFVFYTTFSKCEMMYHKEERKIPISVYLLLAFVTLVTMGFSNASLEYLNYPTQVIFKSCKLIPVLIGGIFIQKKSYNLLDFAAACLMCAGLIIFMLADSKLSPNFHWIGVLMLFCALTADAVIGNMQERAMKMYGGSNAEVILFSFGIGSVYLITMMVATGSLVPGVLAFSSVDPVMTYGGALIFSMTGYLGTQVVLTLVRKFGAFAAVTVTSLRKAFSIVLSFVLFSKPFSFQYLVGGVVVLIGIYLNLLAKNTNNSQIFSYFLKMKKFTASFTNEKNTKYAEV